jgi:hypothetical protein
MVNDTQKDQDDKYIATDNSPLSGNNLVSEQPAKDDKIVGQQVYATILCCLKGKHHYSIQQSIRIQRRQ